MKTNLKFMLPMLAIAATSVFYSCSSHDDDGWYEQGLPDPDKELVSFSSQDGQVASRAYMAGSRAGLDANNTTKIVMNIKSVGANSTDIRYTRTVAQASKEQAKDHDSKHEKLNDTHSDVSYPSTGGYFRYWDDAFGRDAKLSVYAVAVPGKDDANVLPDSKLADNTSTSKVSDTNPNWFTSETNVGKCAWELPLDQTGGSTTPNANYDLCYSNNIRTNGQKGVYKYVYASTGWTISELTNGNMMWRAKESGSTVGKFDEGNLIFKHALCKVTINIKEGSGFNNSAATDFNFKSGTNVSMLDFPYKGTLNVVDGSWGSVSNETITKMEETTGTPAVLTTRTVTGYTLPGKELKGSNDNALHFIIDGNDYYVTNDQIASAIQTYYAEYEADGTTPNAKYDATLAGFTTMTQGHHYVINLTISKTKIENITAQLVGWEEVNSANIDPTNAYVNVELETREGSTVGKVETDIFNLYRKPSVNSAWFDGTNLNLPTTVTEYNNFLDYAWTTGYETTAATKDYNNNKWSTGWYWPNNYTYYHIRAIGATSGDKPALVSNSTADNFVIKAGNIEGTPSDYKDYIWGAPFVKKTNTTDKFFYNTTKGFDAVSKDDASTDGTTPSQTNHQIWKAIGAVNYVANPIVNMMLFHMTSQIFFEVTTTTGTEQVALQTTSGGTTTNTKVELLRVYTNGTVLLGNGLVDVTGTKSDAVEMEMPATGGYRAEAGGDPALSKHQYGMVPQALSGTGYTVGVRITTPDGNQYVINDISAISATVTSNNIANPYTSDGNGKFTINRWYPGYQYKYTVILKKTGIVSITAQLVDWEKVEGNIGEITLED